VKRVGGLLIALLMAGTAQAQFPPGGGRPSASGAPPAGMPPGAAMKMPTLEELVPPDPLRLWHADLLRQRGAFGLDAAQGAAFEAWMGELRDVVTLNERRLWVAIGRSRPVVSARADVMHDLAGELDQASERVRALEDLITRWKALQDVLTPTQRERLVESYAQSRVPGGQRAAPR
jgi:hypothetical protein